MSTNIALADSRPLRGGACDVTALCGGAGLGRVGGEGAGAMLCWIEPWIAGGAEALILGFCASGWGC